MMTIANTLSLTKPDMNTTNCDVWMLSKVVMGLSISRSAGGSFETSTRTYEGLSGVTTQGEEFLESRKKGSASSATLYHDNRCNNKCFGQPFGSMPRLSNSLRKSRFIHPALLSSPSSFIAIDRRSERSGSRRSCTTFLSLWFSLVDIGVHPFILIIVIVNVHHCKPISKAPQVLGTHAGLLITTLKQVTL